MAKEETEVEAVDPNVAILAAFNKEMDAGKEGDDVKMEMIKAGAVFKNVGSLYNKFMIDTGRAMSKEAKDTLLSDTLTDKDLSTEDGLKAVVAVLVKKGKNVTDKSAASLVRAWAKKAEVECYKAPASEGTRNPFIPIFHKALIENPKMTEDQLKGIIDGLEKDEWKVNPTRWLNTHNQTRVLANTIVANLSA